MSVGIETLQLLKIKKGLPGFGEEDLFPGRKDLGVRGGQWNSGYLKSGNGDDDALLYEGSCQGLCYCEDE